MATQQEISSLIEQYAKFDAMFMAAAKTGNTTEVNDIQLQMGKIREKLDTMGVITTPHKMSNLRNQRQEEFAQIWLDKKWGILNLCPRFGKIYTTINILEKMNSNISILIAYPDLKIKDSWEQDFKARGYNNSQITYTTHLSLHKYVNNEYDMVIIDEIHLLSDAQIDAVQDLTLLNHQVLGLTGTLSTSTESELDMRLDLPVLAYYPIEQAIQKELLLTIK